MSKAIEIPFGSPVYRNADETELSDKSYKLQDGYLDTEEGGSVRRPGLDDISDSQVFGNTAAVNGLYWWEEQQIAVASLFDGYLSRLDWNGSSLTYTQISGGKRFPNPNICSFATDGTDLVVANGEQMYRYSATAEHGVISDVDAPTLVTHVAFMDGYILANLVGTGEFYWSALDDETAWDALDFENAEGSPDVLTALHVFNKEIFLAGPRSIEFWENDGVSPFSRSPGGSIDIGCIAPYSIVNTEKGIFFLTSDRHFVYIEGRTINRLDSDYDRDVQQFEVVEDCIGGRVEIDGYVFVIFSFGLEDRTLVYCITTDSWSEWGRYISQGPYYEAFLGRLFVNCPAWNVRLVGGRVSNKLYNMRSDVFTDDGELIRLCRQTGHIDHGTGQQKELLQLLFRIKTAHAGTSTTPQLMLRWRDNGNHVWGAEKLISLRDQGDARLLARLYNLGSYETRQWEISCTDAVPVIFLKAEGLIEELV